MRNPWLDLPARPPFVLPCDRDVVEQFNVRVRARAREDLRLQLQHLPEPFLGRKGAPVVLLNLNPGFSEADDEWHSNPKFVAELRSNLAHRASRWPFYLLNPRLQSPGHAWWRSRMRELIDATSAEAVARNVLCVELHAYHSVRFGLGRIVVPSQAYGIHLVREAMARGALIVRMRAQRRWFEHIPELPDYGRLIRTNSAQCAYLSRENLGPEFEQVVDAIRTTKARP